MSERYSLVAEPFRGTSYMLMSLPGGNMIDSFNNIVAAYETLIRMLWEEPAARDSMGLVAFDSEGIAVRRLWPDPDGSTRHIDCEISQELAHRMYDALTEIAFAPESSEWAKRRAAQAFYIITDPPPQDALDLGRELAKRYGW